MAATTAELEAYRQGYNAGLRASAKEVSPRPGARQYVLALGTLAFGLGGVAALIAARKPGGDGDILAAFAVASGLAGATLGATRVLLGEPTPTFRLS